MLGTPPRIMGALYMGRIQDPAPSPSLPPLGDFHFQLPKIPGWGAGEGREGLRALGTTSCIVDDPCLSFPEPVVVGGEAEGSLVGVWSRAARQGDPGQRRGQWVFVCQGDGDPPAAGPQPDNGIMGALLVRGARAPPTHPQH